MKTLYESIFDVEDNIENLDKSTFNIPSISDFYMYSYERKDYAVCWPCREKLAKYRLAAWKPKDSYGITFKICSRDGKHYISAQFNGPKGPRDHAWPGYTIKGWFGDKYADKPISYNKKVVLSLIEHLAKNPAAFEEMINYIREVRLHDAAKQSYDDGTFKKTRDFAELMKING